VEPSNSQERSAYKDIV